MATYTKIVDPNGGGDYVSLSAWQVGEKGLYSSGDTAQAICRRTGATKDTTALSVTGWTAGVNVKITVDSNYKHNGKWADKNALGNYIYIITMGTDYAATISVSQALVEIDDMLIENTSATGSSGISMGSVDGVIVQRSIFKCANNGFTSDAYGKGSYNLYNCLFYNCKVGYNDGRGDGGSGRYCHVYNCTASGCTSYGFKGGYGTNFYNCLSVGNTTGDFQRDSATPTSDYNVSSDATAFGANKGTGKTSYATYFTDKTNGDLHLKDNSTNLFGLAGTSESGSFTDDIDGTTRSNWDIGYDEYVASGVTTLQTILGKTRITESVLQTIPGKSRVQEVVAKTITGKANVSITGNLSTGYWGVTFGGGSTTTPQTVLGKASIQKTVAKIILGKSSIQEIALQTILGKGSVLETTLQPISGKARVGKVSIQTIAGKGRITESTLQTIAGKARIGKVTQQTLLGVSRIGKVTPQTITGVARIGKVSTQTVQGKSRITETTLQTVSGKSRVTETTPQTITGKAKIAVNGVGSHTILGRASIKETTQQTVLGKGSIQETVAKTITGKASILESSTVTKTILGKSSIKETTQQTVQGKARIGEVTTRTIQGKAHILESSTTTQDIVGQARITETTQKGILGKASIVSASTGKTIKVFINGTWSSYPLKVYENGTWQNVTKLKYYDGTQWVEL